MAWRLCQLIRSRRERSSSPRDLMLPRRPLAMCSSPLRGRLGRSLEGDWPYLWLDATYLKVREGGRIVSVAAIIAVAANTEGRREIVGLVRW
jgi:hypothetical protein